MSNGMNVGKSNFGSFFKNWGADPAPTTPPAPAPPPGPQAAPAAALQPDPVAEIVSVAPPAAVTCARGHAGRASGKPGVAWGIMRPSIGSAYSG